jgi:single-stranded-DNA-specific exonuclease
MQKKWLIKNQPESFEIENLRSELKVDRIVASLLFQRGITSFNAAQSFFRPQLTDLHDPFLMKNMEGAVNRLDKALKQNEKVLIYGDYDVDGTTSVAMVYSFLANYTDQIDYYIPDRYSEGYGVSFEGIDYANQNGFSLIIALDCGVKSVDKVDYANEKNIDFIVCDHHNPGEELPACFVLDPKQKDCDYPYKELSGCGVGFKLLQGLCLKNNWSFEKLFEFLDFVAISIGADIVPITGENRILCFHGMRLLNETTRTSFKSLLELAGKTFPLNLTDVVFTIAPRINAAGRIRSGKYAVELMISNDTDEIKTIAAAIDLDNQERRSLDQEITLQALEQIESDSTFSSKKATVVFQEDWHKGVVGIVASRLIEKHFKPTIVLTESNGFVTGSARTVNQFNIHDALVACEHLLEQFGGHQHAAGLTLKKDNLSSFIETFNQIVSKSISLEDEHPIEHVDIEIHFDEIFQPNENRMKIPRLKRILNQLEPHGPGNMKPVFLTRNVYTTSCQVLKEAHLKLTVVQADSDVQIEAIGFNMADKREIVADGLPFEMIYTIEVNRWKQRETVQLIIKDIRSLV